MEPIFAHYTATHLFAAGLGLALLAFGRKLYWLALGGIGFFIGLWLANHFLHLRSTGLELGAGFLAGVLCAYLTTAAQRLAIGLGGFLVGGAVAYWTAGWVAPSLGWPSGPWMWVAALLGAMLGAFFASLLFDASLIALTALLGALLVTKASQLGPPHEAWLFLLLMCLGVLTQSGGKRQRRAPA